MNNDVVTVLHDGPPMDAREERLADAADEMASGGTSIFARDKFLLTLAGVLMLLGIAIIGLALVGASHSIHIEQQIPYLISGGLLGLALAVIGAQCLFAHWHTVSIREARCAANAARSKEHDELMARSKEHQELIVRLLRVVEAHEHTLGAANGQVPPAKAQRPLRRAPRPS